MMISLKKTHSRNICHMSQEVTHTNFKVSLIIEEWHIIIYKNVSALAKIISPATRIFMLNTSH